MDNTIEKHISALAELFIAKFDSIAGDWRKPWLETLPFASQNAAGHLYSGVNDVNLSLTCAMKGYSTPVWLTSAQCRDLGLMRGKGESGSQVFWGGTSFFDKDKGRIDEDMRWAEYQRLSQSEKDRYSLRENLGHSTFVWNIEQTDFPQKHPDTWANLKAAFASEHCEYSESTLDNFLECGDWYPDDCHKCPVVTTDNGVMGYDAQLKIIEIPSKEKFSNQKEFYCTLLHALARSAIIEHNLANPKKDADPLSQAAKTNLAAELASAVVAGRLGMSQTLSESSLQYLKQWTALLSDDPSVIREVTRQSRVAVQMMTRQIGITQMESPDICATLGLQIQQAQQKRAEKSIAKTQSGGQRINTTTFERSGKPKLGRSRSHHF